MRHVWGFVSALGLLTLVVFGTWGCLSSMAGDPSAQQTTLIALGGAAVMVVGLIGRSHLSHDHAEDASGITAARRAIGGLGLVVAVVTGAMTLLAVIIDPSAVPTLLLVTLVAMLGWAQGIAAQVGLSVRISFSWLAVLALFGAVVLVVGAGLVAIMVGGFGLETRAGTWIAFILVAGLFGGIVTAWTKGRPDRSATTKAVGRAALGRAAPPDLEVLAAGPAAVFRRRPTAAADGIAADVRLAAADARFVGANGDPDSDGEGR